MSTERPPLRLIEGSGPREPHDPRRPRLPAALELAALGVALTATVVWLGRVPSWFHDLGTFELLFATAFVFYALTLARARHYAELPGVEWVVLAVAVATRAALLPAPPSLSGDIYRYVWEGWVALHGGNPYLHAPLDVSLAPLRDGVIFPHVNHPELATIYPPASIAGYLLVAAISPTVVAAKLWVILHDVALVAVLLAWARRAGRPALWVAAYAWNPLVLIEFAGNGHNDPTALLWLAIALAWRKDRPLLSAASLALGGLTKLVPLLALPFLMRRWPWRARALAGAALAVGLGWFWMQTRHDDSGVIAYWNSWRNNELLFHYLDRWTGGFERARTAGLVLLAAAIGWAWWRRWGTERATRFATRTALLVSPVLHPWYLGYALMFEPMTPSAPWLLLSLTAVLNYGVLATPAAGRDFHLGLAWRWVEYGAPLVLALILAVRARGRRGETAAPD